MVPVVIEVETRTTGRGTEDEAGAFSKRPKVVGVDGKHRLLKGVPLDGVGEENKKVGHLAWIGLWQWGGRQLGWCGGLTSNFLGDPIALERC